MLRLKKMTIILNNSMYLNGEPLYREILKKAYELDIAGGTASDCIEGFGTNTRLKKKTIARINTVAPIRLEIVDELDKLSRLLPFLEQHLTKGIITMEDVDVIKFTRDRVVPEQ